MSYESQNSQVDPIPTYLPALGDMHWVTHTNPLGDPIRRYTIAGLDRWTGPVDWNGGLAEIVPKLVPRLSVDYKLWGTRPKTSPKQENSDF